MAMQGIASILGGKSSSDLLRGSSDQADKAKSDSFLQALQSIDKPGNVVAAEENKEELWDKFREFVGNTMFGQMLSSMRKTVDKPAYFHGGQTEEIFQQHLDQHLVKHVTDASSETSTMQASPPISARRVLGIA